MQPAIILVQPQMGENIGAAARAMLNFGLTDLRLVAPRDGWPNVKAVEMSAGALDKITPKVFADFKSAVADLDFLFATTSRQRDMQKPVIALNEITLTKKTGIVFGPERTGLENDDISLCDKLVFINVNPEFKSLNLAQSVAIACYQISLLCEQSSIMQTEAEPASKDEMAGLFGHLEEELSKRNFFSTPEKKPGMIVNIRNIFSRASLSGQELRTLRGIIRCLSEKK